MKVVINGHVGGFNLSSKAIYWMAEKQGVPYQFYEARWKGEHRFENRDDPLLVQAVEELGAEADGEYARLKVVDIPDNTEYIVLENDCGTEWIAERHRTWD
jgi:predicted ATP-grasp superfamily ATP-dependent carboligase